VNRDGRKSEIEFKVLIGADGVTSRVLDLIGERDKRSRTGKAVVYEYKNVKLDYPELDQIYFGDFAPGGYAHIFPLPGERANLGVGSILEDADIQKCFKKFISDPRVKPQLNGATAVREKSGNVSFDPLSNSRLYGNVLLAGEAGSQNIKPLMEGFFPSIICGDIAGKSAASYILNGDSLDSYERGVDRKLGVIFRESDKLTRVLGDIGNLNSRSYLLLCGLSANIFSINDISVLKDETYERLNQRLVTWKQKKARRFLTVLSENLIMLYLKVNLWVNKKVFKV
jgi:digeranylgeranylglycerophospholipid reductase